MKEPPTDPPPKFRIGQRVWEVEWLGLCKVVEFIKRDPSGREWYRVRQYADPHHLYVTDDIHLGPPEEMRHDPRNEQWI